MISFCLWAVASICSACIDTLNSFYITSRFAKWFGLYSQFWNPQFSWRAKWKNGDRSNGEKFWGSSTFLVWTTDAFHLVKLLMLACFLGAILTYEPMLDWYDDAIIYVITWFSVFEISYRWFKIEL